MSLISQSSGFIKTSHSDLATIQSANRNPPFAIESLAPERDYRINLRRSSRRDVAGQQRREREQYRNDDKGRRVARANAEEQALHRPASRQRRQQPDRQTE